MKRRRRGFTTVLVLVVVAMATVVLAAVQTAAYAEAMTGREALGRVRAHWAARAGVESAIARLAFNTQSPDEGNAFALVGDMADVAEGSLRDAIYRVSHSQEGREVLGPADAHARININLMTREQLMTLPLMTEDVADAILDWIDDDDDTNPMGAEIGYYASLAYAYEPRNAPMRRMEELELVAGVYGDLLRAEDANLSGLLDPEEDDGDLTWPTDNSDGRLDAGWSGILTASSVDDVLTPSGRERLDLRAASEGDLMQRTGVDAEQARSIVEYVAERSDAQMRDFIAMSPANLMRRIGASQDRQRQAGGTLSNEQLGKLLDECGLADAAAGPRPGRLNINTCPAEVLEYLPSISPALADSIILERESRLNGFTSIVDLLEIPAVNRQSLARIYPLLTVRSNVYIATSRGRDLRTGLEVEMIATLDRSTLPVVIKEFRVR